MTLKKLTKNTVGALLLTSAARFCTCNIFLICCVSELFSVPERGNTMLDSLFVLLLSQPLVCHSVGENESCFCHKFPHVCVKKVACLIIKVKKASSWVSALFWVEELHRLPDVGQEELWGPVELVGRGEGWDATPRWWRGHGVATTVAKGQC